MKTAEQVYVESQTIDICEIFSNIDKNIDKAIKDHKLQTEVNGIPLQILDNIVDACINKGFECGETVFSISKRKSYNICDGTADIYISWADQKDKINSSNNN